MPQPLRVGIGFDVHRLVGGRRLMISGVLVPHTLGALAHSDGDVVFHAVADAILGAAGMGDLGDHFPDSDPKWAGADSALILAGVVELVRRQGWRVASADVNVLLKQPRLSKHKEAMQRRLSEVLVVTMDAVGIKARTMEGLGPIGEGQAVAAQAVVLIEKGTGA